MAVVLHLCDIDGCSNTFAGFGDYESAQRCLDTENVQFLVVFCELNVDDSEDSAADIGMTCKADRLTNDLAGGREALKE